MLEIQTFVNMLPCSRRPGSIGRKQANITDRLFRCITHLVATGEGPLAQNALSSAAIEIFHQSQQALLQRAEEQARKNIIMVNNNNNNSQ